MSVGVEGKSESDNWAEAGRCHSTKLQQPASLTSSTSSDRLEPGSGNQHSAYRSPSTSDLRGHADVTGSSSAVHPLRSASSSGALSSARARGQATTTAEDGGGEDSAAGEGDLLNCLLRAAGTTATGGSADNAGGALLPRRRRRSNAAETVDAAATAAASGIRERTSSPVGVGVVGDLGQRSSVRRRSLPTPRPTVRDAAVPSFTTALGGIDNSAPAESSACSELRACSISAADARSTGVKQDERLSDIDENITMATTSSALPHVSVTTNNSATNYIRGGSEVLVTDVSLNEDQKVVGSAISGQKSAENTIAIETQKVDAVQHNDSHMSGRNSTESALRQTWSSDDVDVSGAESSAWMPRRSQSLRLYRVRARSAAARGEHESEQLDANVHEFQTRAAPEREALRNRLRKLSLIYASTDSDETSRTWPASRRPCADGEDGSSARTTVATTRRRDDNLITSASSSTSTLQLKYDTDSLSSQKDEGFETASISSDVYLSSSQRSSMCDCDASLTSTPTTLERRTDATTTKPTTDTVAAEYLPEILPPPPASFLSGPEVIEANTPGSGGNCFTSSTEKSPPVLPRSEPESVEFDAQRHPSSDTSSLSVASTQKKKFGDANTETCGREVSRGGAKNGGSVRRTAQTVGTRQTKTTTTPAPATPCRSSSLAASPMNRSTGSTRSSSGAVTNNRASGRASIAVRASIPPLAGAVATSSTSGRQAGFQRSSPLRATDERKSTPQQSGRSGPPPSSSAFVRQSQTRATISAPVLRTNKRAAAEARKMKASVAATTPGTVAPNSGDDPSSRQTATVTSTSGSVVPRPHHPLRIRASSGGGSGSSISSAAAAPKLTSFRRVGSRTSAASAQNVPCVPSKKADGGAPSSSSVKMPSNLRNSTQTPNSRLRAPTVTKKNCSS